MNGVRKVILGFFFFLSIGCFFLFFKFSSIRRDYQTKTRGVYIQKKESRFELIRNGKPFLIRGACGDSNLELLSKIGGNTVRIYDTIDVVKRLDLAELNNLAVIIDIDIPKFTNDYEFYEDKESVEKLKRSVSELVRKCKDRPALLIWNLGNEINYPYVLYKKTFTNLISKSFNKKENAFIRTFNELIDIIHSIDPDHPVATTFIVGSTKKQVASIYLNSPELDLLSYNIFGALTNYEFESKELDFLFGRKPYFIGEFGSDGPWSTECEVTSWGSKIEPTSAKKAEQIKARFLKIEEMEATNCLGSMFFFWGNKQECTHTWFSLFDENGAKSEVVHGLQNLWNAKQISLDSIGIQYMLIDQKGARDNIIVVPGDTIQAEVKLTGNINEVSINWELYPDAWNITGTEEETKLSKIDCNFVSYSGNRLLFVTPKSEGPYRLFVKVLDKSGYFATANTPFYVLKNQ